MYTPLGPCPTLIVKGRFKTFRTRKVNNVFFRISLQEGSVLVIFPRKPKTIRTRTRN